jgi:hypothetical protein
MVIKPLCFGPPGIGYSRVLSRVTFDLHRYLICIILVGGGGANRWMVWASGWGKLPERPLGTANQMKE